MNLEFFPTRNGWWLLARTDEGIVPVQSASSSPCVHALHQLSPSSLFLSPGLGSCRCSQDNSCVWRPVPPISWPLLPHTGPWRGLLLPLQPKPAAPVSVFSLAIAFSLGPSHFLHATVMWSKSSSGADLQLKKIPIRQKMGIEFNVFNMKSQFLLESGGEKCPHKPKAWTAIPSYTAKGCEASFLAFQPHPLAVADGKCILPILCL